MIYTPIFPILPTLARHSIVVGSVARGGVEPKDLDLLVTPRGLDLAYILLPDPVQISHSGNRIKTMGRDSIDCFVRWAGPTAEELFQTHRIHSNVLFPMVVRGVRFLCWKGETL